MAVTKSSLIDKLVLKLRPPTAIVRRSRARAPVYEPNLKIKKLTLPEKIAKEIGKVLDKPAKDITSNIIKLGEAHTKAKASTRAKANWKNLFDAIRHKPARRLLFTADDDLKEELKPAPKPAEPPIIRFPFGRTPLKNEQAIDDRRRKQIEKQIKRDQKQEQRLIRIIQPTLVPVYTTPDVKPKATYADKASGKGIVPSKPAPTKQYRH